MATKEEIDLEYDLDIKEPSKYKVLLLNDDYSTFDFVVSILVNIFKKNTTEATKLTYEVHNKGKAVCGVYTYEIASTKVAQVKSLAKQAGYPLKAILEKD